MPSLKCNQYMTVLNEKSYTKRAENSNGELQNSLLKYSECHDHILHFCQRYIGKKDTSSMKDNHTTLYSISFSKSKINSRQTCCTTS